MDVSLVKDVATITCGEMNTESRYPDPTPSPTFQKPLPTYRSRISGLLQSKIPFQGYEHLKTFSEFLNDTKSVAKASLQTSKQNAFVYAYRLDERGLSKVVASHTAEEFRNRRESQYDVLICSGQPSADWMTCLGDELSLPAEFWTKHLDFMAVNDRERYIMQGVHLALPQIITLDIPSLLFAGTSGRFLDQEKLHTARHSASKQIDNRLKEIRWGVRNNVGDPIFRALNVHRGDLLSVEQRVTVICLPRSPNNSARTKTDWSVLMYTDGGTGEHGLEEMLNNTGCFVGNSTISFCPINIFSTDTPQSVLSRSHTPQQLPSNMPALAGLASAYGSSIGQYCLSDCPFDVLAEIFHIALCGIGQLLVASSQILDEQIRCFISTPEAEVLEYATVASFHYHRTLLTRHTAQLTRITHWIETRGGASWYYGKVNERTDLAWDELLTAAQDLLKECSKLVKECDHGEALVRDKRAADEMRLSGQTASSMARLTQVTTIFTVFWVPISFSTSVFGMNFRELNSGSLSIWIWISVFVPCVLASLALLYFIRKRSKHS